MPLPHEGRPFRPIAAHPASRILDDPRSLGQLFEPSSLQRVELPNGPVAYDTMHSQYQAARYRSNPAIHAGRTEAPFWSQSLVPGDEWATPPGDDTPPHQSFAQTFAPGGAISNAIARLRGLLGL